MPFDLLCCFPIPAVPCHFALWPVDLHRAAALHLSTLWVFFCFFQRQPRKNWRLVKAGRESHRGSFVLYCPTVAHNVKLTSSGPGVPNRSVRSLATQLEVSGGQNQNHPCLPPFVGKLSSMKPVCSQNVGDLSYGIEQRIWGPPQAS